MPWHWVQFLRMTCHTGPSGRSTFGRVAPRFCPATGTAMDTATAAQAKIRINFIVKPTPGGAPYYHRGSPGVFHINRECSTACSNISAHYRERQCDDSL